MSCAHAGCDLDDVLRCSRCRSVGYCSKGHQKADWRGHKSFCGKEEDGKEDEADAAESTIVDVEEVLLRRGNRKVANHDLEGALADYTRVVDMFENDDNTLDDGSLAISRAVVARAMSRRASVQNLQGNWNEAAVSALGALDRTPTLESAHLAYAAALEGMDLGSHMRCSALWEGQRQCPESTRLYECYHKCPWAHKLLVGKQQIVRRGGVRVVDGEEEGEAGGAGEAEDENRHVVVDTHDYHTRRDGFADQQRELLANIGEIIDTSVPELNSELGAARADPNLREDQWQALQQHGCDTESERRFGRFAFERTGVYQTIVSLAVNELRMLKLHYDLWELARLQPGQTLLLMGSCTPNYIDATWITSLARTSGVRVIADGNMAEYRAFNDDEQQNDELERPDAFVVEADLPAAEFAAEVRAQNGGRGVDVVYDPNNDWYSLAALSALREQGRYVRMNQLGRGKFESPRPVEQTKKCEQSNFQRVCRELVERDIDVVFCSTLVGVIRSILRKSRRCEYTVASSGRHYQWCEMDPLARPLDVALTTEVHASRIVRLVAASYGPESVEGMKLAMRAEMCGELDPLVVQMRAELPTQELLGAMKDRLRRFSLHELSHNELYMIWDHLGLFEGRDSEMAVMYDQFTEMRTRASFEKGKSFHRAEERDRLQWAAQERDEKGSEQFHADVGRECAADGCETPGTLKCSKCKLVHYCGSACQKKHWKSAHKKACRGVKPRKARKEEQKLIKKMLDDPDGKCPKPQTWGDVFSGAAGGAAGD